MSNLTWCYFQLKLHPNFLEHIYSNLTIKLTENQETKIIETCLDWLIQDEKVAAKAYSMITLYNFGKKYPWINEDLKTILSQDYFKHSAAYQAAAKDILLQLK